jgi:hypothetical protein
MTAPYNPRPQRWPQFNLRKLFVLVTILGVLSCWLGAEIESTRIRRSETAMRIVLDGPVSFAFVNIPLTDAIDYLKEFHQIEIRFDTESFESLGITPQETMANTTLSGIPLRSALRLLLSRIDDSLAFVINGETLLIGTRKRIYAIAVAQHKSGKQLPNDNGERGCSFPSRR